MVEPWCTRVWGSTTTLNLPSVGEAIYRSNRCMNFDLPPEKAFSAGWVGQVLVSAGGKGTVCRLPQTLRVSVPRCWVGSGPACTLVISHPEIHPLECLLVLSPRGLFAQNFSGRALRNGRPFWLTELSTNDKLQVGPVEILIVEVSLPQMGGQNVHQDFSAGEPTERSSFPSTCIFPTFETTSNFFGQPETSIIHCIALGGTSSLGSPAESLGQVQQTGGLNAAIGPQTEPARILEPFPPRGLAGGWEAGHLIEPPCARTEGDKAGESPYSFGALPQSDRPVGGSIPVESLTQEIAELRRTVLQLTRRKLRRGRSRAKKQSVPKTVHPPEDGGASLRPASAPLVRPTQGNDQEATVLRTPQSAGVVRTNKSGSKEDRSIKAGTSPQDLPCAAPVIAAQSASPTSLTETKLTDLKILPQGALPTSTPWDLSEHESEPAVDMSALSGSDSASFPLAAEEGSGAGQEQEVPTGVCESSRTEEGDEGEIQKYLARLLERLRAEGRGKEPSQEGSPGPTIAAEPTEPRRRSSPACRLRAAVAHFASSRWALPRSAQAQATSAAESPADVDSLRFLASQSAQAALLEYQRRRLARNARSKLSIGIFAAVMGLLSLWLAHIAPSPGPAILAAWAAGGTAAVMLTVVFFLWVQMIFLTLALKRDRKSRPAAVDRDSGTQSA